MALVRKPDVVTPPRLRGVTPIRPGWPLARGPLRERVCMLEMKIYFGQGPLPRCYSTAHMPKYEDVDTSQFIVAGT